MKIKEQELARLAQIKELLQQKLAEEKARTSALQKELDAAKAQSNAVPPQLLNEISQIRTEVGRFSEKLAQLEARVLKPSTPGAKPGGSTASGEKSSETAISIEEKVDQIFTSLNQFLAKVRVASKMPKAPAAEGQPAAIAETKEPPAARALKPSDLLRKQSVETESVSTPEPPESKPEESAPPPVAAKPSDILKRHQAAEAAEAAEAALEQEPAAPKSDKPKKLAKPAKAKASVEPTAETGETEASEEEEGGEKKGKEAEIPGGGIITVPYPSDGSIVCPKCNKQNYQEMQDPSNVVAYAPVKKFGRKFYCKSCRCNWRYKM